MWNERSAPEAGVRPGQLHAQPTRVQVHVARYGAEQWETEQCRDLAILPPVPAQGCLWLDIEGQPGDEGLRALQSTYGLHQLSLEDVQNQGQNPKLDAFDTHLYLVLQLPRLVAGELVFKQVNLFLAQRLVIAIHPHPGLFDAVRGRLASGRGIIRAAGAEYLLYALADVVVDMGFPLVQQHTDRLHELEDSAMNDDGDLSREIYAVRRQLSVLQRQAHGQRELLRRLVLPDHALMSGEFEVYWRDCLDHAERLYENVTYLRESAADLLNTHLALISHRMNEVIKVLTIMSTVFVPLSFLVGLYGMNFDTESPWNLPELSWRYGYLFVWGLMITVVIVVMVFFKRKRWL